MNKKYSKFGLISLFAVLLLFSCDTSTNNSMDTGGVDVVGKGGSTARFTICGNYLYTVNNYDMRVFDITTPDNPATLTKVSVGFGIETIFPRGDSLLFVGSQNGMYIYRISPSGIPNQVSYFQHIKSCDPVVADANYAYVTLNSTHSWCGRSTNELQIIDISNINYPNLKASYPLYGPQGLGIDNKTLFICDAGLKVYDVTNVMNVKLKHNFNISATDVIPYHGNLLVIGNDGFYQYKYQNDTITFLSKISKN
jgi:hypothetical protein